MTKEKQMYYSDYLGLDKVLNSQFPKSESLQTIPAHDEMLFIITHQAFELWFRQVIHEFDAVIENLNKEEIDDNKGVLSQIVARLQRVIKIFRLMNQQFDILETMTPLDFLEFRGLLSPASGFQSKQFRLIEAKMGLRMESRHNSAHYKNTHTNKGGFRETDYEEITQAENNGSLLSGLKKWLNRMPFFEPDLWDEYTMTYPGEIYHHNKFITDFLRKYSAGEHDERFKAFKDIFIDTGDGVFSSKEMTSALFIMVYRHYPILHKPFELMESLIEIDKQISDWRHRHLLMVKKMIGFKIGTGGSSGAGKGQMTLDKKIEKLEKQLHALKQGNDVDLHPDEGYLAGTIKKNATFEELTTLATYYIEKDKLPVLPEKLISRLKFQNS